MKWLKSLLLLDREPGWLAQECGNMAQVRFWCAEAEKYNRVGNRELAMYCLKKAKELS